MTDNVAESNEKGYFGEDAEDQGRPADERDVQRAPAGGKAANVGTEFDPNKDDEQPYTTTQPQ